jgi:hypothetical protein
MKFLLVIIIGLLSVSAKAQAQGVDYLGQNITSVGSGQFTGNGAGLSAVGPQCLNSTNSGTVNQVWTKISATQGYWGTPASGGSSAVTNISTAYYSLPFDVAPAAANSGRMDTTNRVFCYKRYLPISIDVKYMTLKRASTTLSGGFMSSGIYSADGNSLLVDMGPCSTTSSSILHIKTNSTAVTLPAGWYWYAYTADNTNATYRASTAVADINGWNGLFALFGYGANTSTAGQLPSTLGAVTAAAADTSATMPLGQLIAVP